MKIALATGALPEAGGLNDQEAPFVDALDETLEGLADAMRRPGKGAR